MLCKFYYDGEVLRGKRYGDDNTILRLSPEAQEFYNETEPFDIYEVVKESEDDDGDDIVMWYIDFDGDVREFKTEGDVEDDILELKNTLWTMDL